MCLCGWLFKTKCLKIPFKDHFRITRKSGCSETWRNEGLKTFVQYCKTITLILTETNGHGSTTHFNLIWFTYCSSQCVTTEATNLHFGVSADGEEQMNINSTVSNDRGGIIMMNATLHRVSLQVLENKKQWFMVEKNAHQEKKARQKNTCFTVLTFTLRVLHWTVSFCTFQQGWDAQVIIRQLGEAAQSDGVKNPRPFLLNRPKTPIRAIPKLNSDLL